MRASTPSLVVREAGERDGWDALVAGEPSLALLQSWDWGEFKRAAGWTPSRVVVERDGRPVAGAQMLVSPIARRLRSVAYVPRGPVGAWVDPAVASALVAELHAIARRHRAIFLRIEPSAPEDSGGGALLRELGFRESTYTNQPRATLVVDIAPAADEILARMHQKTRYNIRYAARKGVEVRVGGREDLPAFHRLLRLTGRRTGLNPRSLDYYRGEWEMLEGTGRGRLFIATHGGGEPLAANLSAAFGAHAAYLHGASTREHANLQANHLLMWEAMRWAKGIGCRTFDLWGIPDEAGIMAAAGREPPVVTDSTDGLWGVYRFKRGFGGDHRLHVAAHDFVYSKVAYAAVSRVVNASILDRVAAWRDGLRR